MDFHSLTRRELQTLCKKNNIPANVTNVAMADALQALQTVEGLEELLTNPERESLKTPARSRAATPSVTRTSTRQKTIKVEPESTKLTTRARRGTSKADGETEQAKKDMLEAAAPSACTKEGNKSAILRVYGTRRSTRLLDKKMSELSLKENGDIVDIKANPEKDSHELQRKFSEDLDNSQVSEAVPESKRFSEESNVAAEVTEESSVLEIPGQNTEVLLEKDQLPVDGMAENNAAEPLNKNDDQDLENVSTKVGECKNNEGQAVQEDVVEQLDKVSQTEVSNHEFEAQQIVNGTDGTHDEGSLPITMKKEVFSLGSESKATKNDGGSAIASEDNISLGDVSSVLAETQKGIEEENLELAAVNGEEEILGCDTDANAGEAEYSAFPAVAPQTSDISVDYDNAKNVECVLPECEHYESTLSPTKAELSMELKADDKEKETGSSDVSCVEKMCGVEIAICSHVMGEQEAEQTTHFHIKAPEFSEDGLCFSTESDIDSVNVQEVDQLVESIQTKNDNEVAPESLLAEDAHVDTANLGSVNQNNDMVNSASKANESAEACDSDYIPNQSSPFQARPALMQRDEFQVTPCKSLSKRSASVRGTVHISDNKENIEVSARKVAALLDENASAVSGTPVEKKSLRQLKKMVKGMYQQAEEKRPALQARVENVVAGKSIMEN